MVKIVSRKSLGTQPVYDIGVERDHNFVLANGLVASNCFNKSHSTAYAYVTYQTAYLKANYPVEYMAALLTANSGDQDKVQKYIANCQELEITVEGPDINRSDIDFTPSNGKILFGLSAVKNVGEGAIANILAAREKEGKFTSLSELCDRINLQTVNSRALEALIKCGALDSIEKNRKQLIEHLPLVINWAQKSKATSDQPTLFDLSEVRSPAPKAPDTKDFDPKEKLQFEKELLGFYVSDHPLRAMEKITRLDIDSAPITIKKMQEQGKGTINAIVMITEVKKVITKKGDPMAILQIEDLTGKSEAVVFPKTYETVSESLITDAPVILKGKIEAKDEQIQLIVYEARLVTAEEMAIAQNESDSIKDQPEYTVILELTPQEIEEQLDNLKTILEDYRGNDEVKIPVMAIVVGEYQRKAVLFGKEFWVQEHENAVLRLKDRGFSARTQTAI